jgi:hypothetical protein
MKQKHQAPVFAPVSNMFICLSRFSWLKRRWSGREASQACIANNRCNQRQTIAVLGMSRRLVRTFIASLHAARPDWRVADVFEAVTGAVRMISV